MNLSGIGAAVENAATEGFDVMTGQLYTDAVNTVAGTAVVQSAVNTKLQKYLGIGLVIVVCLFIFALVARKK